MTNEKLVLVGAKRFCSRAVMDGAVELGMPFVPRDKEAYNTLLNLTVPGTEDEEGEYANPMFMTADDEVGIRQYIRGWKYEDAQADAGVAGAAVRKKAKPRRAAVASTAAPVAKEKPATTRRKASTESTDA